MQVVWEIEEEVEGEEGSGGSEEEEDAAAWLALGNNEEEALPEGALEAMFDEGLPSRGARLEKLIGWRNPPAKALDNGAAGSSFAPVETSKAPEFLVRWRGLSPIQCTWVAERLLIEAGAVRQLKTWRTEWGDSPPEGSSSAQLHPDVYELLTVERIVGLKPPRGSRSAVYCKRRVDDNFGADHDEANLLSRLRPRIGSSVLVKWLGLDYSQMSWEVWEDVKVLRGARRSWKRCRSVRAPATPGAVQRYPHA